MRTITRTIVTVGAVGAFTFCVTDPSAGIVIGAGLPGTSGTTTTAVPSGNGWGGVAHSDGNGWGR